MDEINNFLSPDERADLNEQLEEVNPSMTTDENVLLNQFMTAKIFIHTCTTSS